MSTRDNKVYLGIPATYVQVNLREQEYIPRKPRQPFSSVQLFPKPKNFWVNTQEWPNSFIYSDIVIQICVG